MGTYDHILLFNLDDKRCALPLSSVERIIRLIEITSLPEGPEILLGIINVHGRIVPVIDIRKRFRLPERDHLLNDRIILARTPNIPVAFVVDEVAPHFDNVEERSVSSENILPGLGAHVAGVCRIGEDIILIYDLDQFLFQEEEEMIQSVIENLPQ